MSRGLVVHEPPVVRSSFLFQVQILDPFCFKRDHFKTYDSISTFIFARFNFLLSSEPADVSHWLAKFYIWTTSATVATSLVLTTCEALYCEASQVLHTLKPLFIAIFTL